MTKQRILQTEICARGQNALSFSTPSWMAIRAIWASSAIWALLMAGCFAEYGGEIETEAEELATDELYRDLAAYWAPRIYHDTDASYYVGDYITNFNFDGDYNGKNNWASLESRTTVPAYVYYSASETQTHYFFGYYIFHPRDWHESIPLERHENDFEGMILAVKKNGSVGELVAMETLAHNQFYQYAAADGITSGADNVDGPVTLHGGSHPRIFIEAKGHGVYGCDARCDSAPGGDGIVYQVGDVAQSPDGGSGNWTRVFTYRLIAMDADGTLDDNQGFWHRRFDICDTCTFGVWGKLRGDDFGTNTAQMPWAWDDGDDGNVFAGDMICDPAKLFDIHLSGLPLNTGFSHAYVQHPFRSHTMKVTAVRSDRHRDSFGGKSDIFVSVVAPGSPAGTDEVINASAWKRDNADLDVWYPFAYGAEHAEGQNVFGTVVTEHSFCRLGTQPITVSVLDSDGANNDDSMGSITLSADADHSAGLDLGDARIKFVLDVR